MKRISIVVPVYNEEENIEHFAQSVAEVMGALPYAYEILFIDDGSRDRSREILRELGARDAHVQSIFLARNSGHQIALTCGTDHADGDAVVTMDGDMQHPPELLPVLLAKWEEGFEIVQTVRLTTEGASLFKRLTSKYYYLLLNALSAVEIQEVGQAFSLVGCGDSGGGLGLSPDGSKGSARPAPLPRTRAIYPRNCRFDGIPQDNGGVCGA